LQKISNRIRTSPMIEKDSIYLCYYTFFFHEESWLRILKNDPLLSIAPGHLAQLLNFDYYRSKRREIVWIYPTHTYLWVMYANLSAYSLEIPSIPPALQQDVDDFQIFTWEKSLRRKIHAAESALLHTRVNSHRMQKIIASHYIEL